MAPVLEVSTSELLLASIVGGRAPWTVRSSEESEVTAAKMCPEGTLTVASAPQPASSFLPWLPLACRVLLCVHPVHSVV